jgi:hypothetical protein
MGKTKEELELEETFEKLERMFPEETKDFAEREYPKPVRPIRPIPNRPERPERLVEQEEYNEPITWKPKKLPNGMPNINFDVKEKSKTNPWIPVIIISAILIAGSICYFGYSLSKQAPPITNVGQNCTPAACSNTCTPAACGACTCTPLVQGSNITCMPATINFFNGTG